jgi:hypothetical protein
MLKESAKVQETHLHSQFYMTQQHQITQDMVQNIAYYEE